MSAITVSCMNESVAYRWNDVRHLLAYKLLSVAQREELKSILSTCETTIAHGFQSVMAMQGRQVIAELEGYWDNGLPEGARVRCDQPEYFYIRSYGPSAVPQNDTAK